MVMPTIIASSVQTGSGEVFAMADFCSSDVVLIKFKSLVSFSYLDLYQSARCLFPKPIASCLVEVRSMVLIIVLCP